MDKVAWDVAVRPQCGWVSGWEWKAAVSNATHSYLLSGPLKGPPFSLLSQPFFSCPKKSAPSYWPRRSCLCLFLILMSRLCLASCLSPSCVQTTYTIFLASSAKTTKTIGINTTPGIAYEVLFFKSVACFICRNGWTGQGSSFASCYGFSWLVEHSPL
jgi:hypothetical protein